MSSTLKLFFCFITSIFTITLMGTIVNAQDTAIINHKEREYSRPANFYEIVKSQDKKTCDNILAKINESYSADSESDSNSNIDTMIYNSKILQPYRLLLGEKKVTPEVFILQYDVDGDGHKEWIYNFFWTMSHRRIASLLVSGNELNVKLINEFGIYRFAKDSVVFYDKVYASGRMNYSKVMSPDVRFMDENKNLIVLSGEEDSYHICNKKYSIYAFSINVKEGEKPICNFISKKKVKCIK